MVEVPPTTWLYALREKVGGLEGAISDIVGKGQWILTRRSGQPESRCKGSPGDRSRVLVSPRPGPGRKEARHQVILKEPRAN